MRRALASTDRGPLAVFGSEMDFGPLLLTIAVREGRDPRGVTLAELDLIFLIGEEFLRPIKPTGADVVVYLVDSDGRLLLHQDADPWWYRGGLPNV